MITMTMRWVAVPLALLLAACGSTTITTTPDAAPATVTVTGSAGEATTAPSSTSTETTAPAPAGPAGVGDSITIAGQSDGENARVKLLQVQRWAGDEFLKPDKGQAMWTVRVQITNAGSVVLDDCGPNMVKLVMNSDEEAQTYFGRKPDLSCFKLGAGKKRVGWLTFQAPKALKPASVQIALNSGFATDVAEFSVR